MMNAAARQLTVVLFCFFVPCLYGFTPPTLQDIEIAIVQQDYNQAKLLAGQWLERGTEDPRTDNVHYYLGLCELRLEEFERSREIFTELIQADIDPPLRDKAYLGLFDAYYLGGQYEQAYDAVKSLLKVSPKSDFSSLIYLKCARVNLRLARWKDAEVYLEKIITQYPQSMEIHLAKQLLNEKQYFAVQVGAFIDQARAQQLVKDFQKKGEYAYVVEAVDKENKKFYRVRVGQLTLLGEAQDLKSRLAKEGYPTKIYP